jgi:hypothetical protein
MSPKDLAGSDAHKAFTAGGAAPTPAPSAPAPAPAAAPSTPAASASPAPSAPSAPSAATPAAPAAAPAAAQAAGEQAKKAATAAGASPAQAEQAKQDMIDAMLDGKPFQVPKGIQFAYQRGGKQVYRPIDEILRNHINHHDYQAGKERLARAQAEIERRDREAMLRDEAFQEEQKWLNEEHERFLKAAAADPDSDDARAYRDHLTQLRENPTYRKMVEDSRKLRQRERADVVTDELGRFDQATSLSGDVATYIERVCAHEKYQGFVEPQELREAYAEALQSGRFRWPDDSDADFETKVNRAITEQVQSLANERLALRERFTKPVSDELAAAQARIKELEAAADADATNGETRRQIARSREARAGAPAGGAPPAQGGKSKDPPKPFMGGTPEARDRVKSWVRGG